MFYTRGYGEDRGFEMNRLDAFAWVTSGVKKVRAVLPYSFVRVLLVYGYCTGNFGVEVPEEACGTYVFGIGDCDQCGTQVGV